MIDKDRIEDLIGQYIKGTGIFRVAVKVSSSNRITVLADKKEGITIDECAAIHRHIEKNLDRNIEDFELQVSSPGLDMPFAVTEQYFKNEGRKVDVVDVNGEKFTGILKNVTEGGFELIVEQKLKGKSKELKDISFNYDQVKSTRENIQVK
jgi:ribosome maturation factor RimP